jgi:YfiH family protein
MNKVLKGFSQKKDGSMSLAVPENAVNRKQFFEEHDLSGMQIAVADSIHTAHVEVVSPGSRYILPETDALVTKHAEIILALTGADCFPVYFEEKTAGIIGLAHCGWRGIVAGVISETLRTIESIGGKAEQTVLTLGPGICAQHFEIGTDTLASFAEYTDAVTRDTGIHVDLKQIIKQQAVTMNVEMANIVDTGECTYCLKQKYFSFRRDQPKVLETQIAYITQFRHRKF